MADSDNTGPRAMADARETSRVLSFSGGGVRGYLSFLMFEEYCKGLFRQEAKREPTTTKELDEFVDKNVLPSFLLIAGTSIGGIIAVLLSIGVPLSIVKATLAEPSRVFSKNSWINPTKWMSSKYNQSGLRQLYIDVVAGGNPNGVCKYQDYLKKSGKTIPAVDLQLRHLKRVCAVTTYDLNSSTSLWLSNNKVPWQDKPARFDRVRLVDAMLSTSAAPNYFPIHEFEYNDEQMKCVDGGIWANDSSLVALFIARGKKVEQCTKQQAVTKYSLFSFGTGYPGKKKWTMVAQAAIGWAVPLTGEIPLLSLFEASTAAAKQFMRGFEEMGLVNYYPFDIELKEPIDLDNVKSIPAQDRVFAEALAEPVDDSSRHFHSILVRALQDPLPDSLHREPSPSPSLGLQYMSLTSPKPSSAFSSTASTGQQLGGPSPSAITGKRPTLQPQQNDGLSPTGGENTRVPKAFQLRVPSGKRQKE